MIIYSLYVYYDFSGYSDIAIGLGRIFGFHFNENFDHPFACTSIAEFWQRWHISLGSFFRDYLLYLPHDELCAFASGHNAHMVEVCVDGHKDLACGLVAQLGIAGDTL